MVLPILVALVVADSAAVKVGSDAYVVGPPLRVGVSISSPQFSRDSRYLTLFDERPEPNYETQKARLAQGVTSRTPQVVRWDLRRGNREVVYTVKPDEVLMRTEPVGPGGDLLISVAVGVPQGTNLTWRAYFAPTVGSPRLLVDGVQARSFQFAASRTDRRAFVLIVNEAEPTRYLFVTPDRTETRELPVRGYQGIFQFRNADGNAVVGLQGPPPNYAVIAQYELDFSTGESRPTGANTEPDAEEDKDKIFEFETVDRSIANLLPGQVPLRDIVAQRIGPGPAPDRLTLVQGAIGITETSPNGLAALYLTDDGYYVREMVRLSPLVRDGRPVAVGG